MHALASDSRAAEMRLRGRGRADGRRAVEQSKVGKELEEGSRGRGGSGVRFILKVGHRAKVSAIRPHGRGRQERHGADFRIQGRSFLKQNHRHEFYYTNLS
jgi:hypothetical protein